MNSKIQSKNAAQLEEQEEEMVQILKDLEKSGQKDAYNHYEGY